MDESEGGAGRPSQDGNEPHHPTPLVTLPGDDVTGKSRAGYGNYERDEKTFTTLVGSGSDSHRLNGGYLPKMGDLLVGIVESVQGNMWILDIKGPFNAILPMSLAPWKVEYGTARKHMDVGDAILAKVLEVDETHRVVCTMKGMGLRKLASGFIAEMPAHLISRVIGKSGRMLKLLKEGTGARVMVGQNGRIWLDGNVNDIQKAIAGLKAITDNPRSGGLEDKVERIFQEFDSRRND